MKIVNGKVRMTRSEWERIGKVAGYYDVPKEVDPVVVAATVVPYDKSKVARLYDLLLETKEHFDRIEPLVATGEPITAADAQSIGPLFSVDYMGLRLTPSGQISYEPTATMGTLRPAFERYLDMPDNEKYQAGLVRALKEAGNQIDYYMETITGRSQIRLFQAAVEELRKSAASGSAEELLGETARKITDIVKKLDLHKLFDMASRIMFDDDEMYELLDKLDIEPLVNLMVEGLGNQLDPFKRGERIEAVLRFLNEWTDTVRGMLFYMKRQLRGTANPADIASIEQFRSALIKDKELMDQVRYHVERASEVFPASPEDVSKSEAESIPASGFPNHPGTPRLFETLSPMYSPN